MKIIDSLKYNYNKRPLLFIMIVALAPRLLAAIFSKGYGMHDDMFGPVQAMQELLEDASSIYKDTPKLLLYPILQYVIFSISEFLNIFDPQAKMYIVRFVHAFYSLWVVYFSYKITLLISTEKNAKLVGIVSSLLWMLPYMSVRNLVELAAAPPVLAAIYFLLKHSCSHINQNNIKSNIKSNNINNINYDKVKDIKYSIKYLVLAGLFFGVSFSMRFQTGLVPIGAGLVFLFGRQFKELLILSFFSLLVAGLFLGIPEYLIWQQPFQSLIDYLPYDSTGNYPNSPWYIPVLLIIGVLLPPMGLMLFLGYLRTWQKHILLFMPTFCFVLFHSIYPNKQERFILTILPMILILSIVGFNNWVENSVWWQKHKKLLKNNWIWFWSINSILLVLFTFTYSKKTRVESFTYLSKKNINSLVIEIDETSTYFAPVFYLGENKNKQINYLYSGYNPEEFNKSFNEKFPNYIIFFDNKNLEIRKNKFATSYNCSIKLDNIITPSLLDNILYFMNPKHNKNYNAYIYKISKLY